MHELIRRDNYDEAAWLLFLATYIGKHPRQGWALLKGIYSRLDGSSFWIWESVSKDPDSFKNWIIARQEQLRELSPLGPLHKNSALDTYKAFSISEDLCSYIYWVQAFKGHHKLFHTAMSDSQNTKGEVFDYLYNSMNQWIKANRSIKFDYLTLLGQSGIVYAEPARLYFEDAYLVKHGARRLFAGSRNVKMPTQLLNGKTMALIRYLDLPFAAQVLRQGLSLWIQSN